jgi:hypothetical protein
MLRNITTSLKLEKYSRNNRYFRLIPVTFLYINSVLTAADYSPRKIPSNTARGDYTVSCCGKPEVNCGKKGRLCGNVGESVGKKKAKNKNSYRGDGDWGLLTG